MAASIWGNAFGAESSMRIYLAGPEVFHPDARDILAAKKAICTRHGGMGLSPADNELPPGAEPHAVARAIRDANIRMIRDCDAVIANISPIPGRGPHADVGTAWEMGFASALGKPVCAYTNAGPLLTARIPVAVESVGRKFDARGFLIEDFALVDNLMLPFDLAALAVFTLPEEAWMADLRGFQACVETLFARHPTAR